MKRIKIYNTEKFALVDDEDYSRYKWYLKQEKNVEYAVRCVEGLKNTKMRMHREILNLDIGDCESIEMGWIIEERI